MKSFYTSSWMVILLVVVALLKSSRAFTAIPATVASTYHSSTLTSSRWQDITTTTTTTTTTKTAKSFSSLNALLDPMLLSAATDPSPFEIQQAFSVATFFPQPFWLLLIVLPNTAITKKIMGGLDVVTLCCLIHFFIVTTSIVQPGGSAPLADFSGVFDPAGNPQEAFLGMMQYPNFVSEEWSHVLTWDLFVGRWIWLDGRKRNIFTSHSVLLCNLIGPPGLLLHWATCLITGKGLPGNEAEELDEP